MYDVGVLEELTRAIDELVSADPAVLGDPEGVIALHRQLARLAAVTTRAVACLETHQGYVPEGAASASGWLGARCGLSAGEARRRVRLGRALRHLPVCESAWLAGDIGSAQVSVLAGARNPATEEALARDEAMLVAEAIRLTHRVFVRVVDYWSTHADPDGTEDAAADQRGRRRLHLSQSYEGLWLGDLVLDPISGACTPSQRRADASAPVGKPPGRPRQISPRRHVLPGLRPPQ